MKYLILARRYRPQTFQDVVGQEAIITTLKNALRFDRVAHAYLFSGSRGVGKTTLARLFAKALNCQSISADLEPCNKCPSCLEILSGQSLDVIEIDGASNRGIDDIRQLNETIGYAPSHGKYKIYIIDEVHMLTKEAFNALLKTLEEPPERAKFFFATTEPHKVLPTIVSRCQRFDLQRLSESQIAHKLLSIASDLKREATPEALHLITSFAEGSLRDAESLFDQILCFTNEPIKAEHVRNVLGLVPDQLFFELDQAFSEGRLPFAFEIVEQLFQMGKDLGHFTEQLINHYRRLTIAKTHGIASLHLHEPLASHIDASTKRYTQSQLFFILETLLNGYALLQKSPMQRATLELMILNILRSKNRIPVEVLVRRLSELEQKLLEPSFTQIDPEITPVVETKEPKSFAIDSKEKLELAPVPFNPINPRSTASPIDLSGAPTPESILPLEKKSIDASFIISNEIRLESPPPLEKKSIEAPITIAPEVQLESPRPLEKKSIEASFTISNEIKPESPLPFEKKRIDKTASQQANDLASNNGRIETLLRFSAVELEGTLAKE